MKSSHQQKRLPHMFLLIALCFLAVYICEILFDLKYDLSLNTEFVSERPWTLITSVFAHSSALHLAHNIFPSILFGYIIEVMTCGRLLIFIFLSTALAGNIAGLCFYPDKNLLGASGGVNGLVGFITGYKPLLILYWGFPMPAILLSLVWLTLDLSGVINPTDNTGHAAHIGGLVTGLLMGIIYRRIHPPPVRKEEKIEDLPEDLIEEWEENYILRE